MASSEQKPFWRSKTLWINVGALLGISFGGHAGIELDPERAMYTLGIFNVLLRGITSERVSWKL